MKSVLLFAVCFLTISAAQVKADTIHCVFTEPFFGTDYDLTTQTLTVTGFDSNFSTKNVSFEIKGLNQFELVEADGTVVQKLTLNNAGSDGMSDAVYPYEATWFFKQGTNPLVGGCESKSLKKVAE